MPLLTKMLSLRAKTISAISAIAVVVPFCLSSSCTTSKNNDSFANIAQPSKGNGKIIIVCNNKGIDTYLGFDDIDSKYQELRRGGSIHTELPAGQHTLHVKAFDEQNISSVFNQQISVTEGETLFFAIESPDSRWLDNRHYAGIFDSNAAYSLAMARIRFTLIPISKEQAARIASY
jgi:hypothetical protein